MIIAIFGMADGRVLQEVCVSIKSVCVYSSHDPVMTWGIAEDEHAANTTCHNIVY